MEITMLAEMVLAASKGGLTGFPGCLVFVVLGIAGIALFVFAKKRENR